jgi:hypothetical protein
MEKKEPFNRYAVKRLEKKSEKEKKEKEAFDKTDEGKKELKKEQDMRNNVNDSKVTEIMHKREKSLKSDKEAMKSAKFRKDLYRKLMKRKRN